MSITTPELVLLDLDGTLVDSIPDLARCLNLSLAENALPERELASVRNWVGNGLDKLIHRAVANDINGTADADIHARVKQVFMRHYHAEPCLLSDCYPGVRDGLTALQERGMQLGVVTNKDEEFVAPILRTLGIEDHMSIIIGGNTLAKKKPDRLPLLHAASIFQKQPTHSLMVGDSISDVKAARAADFQIVCVSYGYNHGQDIRDSNPDAVIDSLLDLPHLFN